MNTLLILISYTRNNLSSRIRSFALCCLLNHLSLTTVLRPRLGQFDLRAPSCLTSRCLLNFLILEKETATANLSLAAF